MSDNSNSNSNSNRNSNSNSNEKKGCVPCSSLDDSALLSIDQVKDQMKQLSLQPFWKLHQHDDQHQQQHQQQQHNLNNTNTNNTNNNNTNNNTPSFLYRDYIAKNFRAALDSINAMGAIAERENHHPDFSLTEYRRVRVVIYTHKLNGITANDIHLAKLIQQQVHFDYSPKWYNNMMMMMMAQETMTETKQTKTENVNTDTDTDTHTTIEHTLCKK